MTEPLTTAVTTADVRLLCGDILDWQVSAILALRPTMEDVSTAAAWAGGHDELGAEGHLLEGKAAEVYDLLTADDLGDEQE